MVAAMFHTFQTRKACIKSVPKLQIVIIMVTISFLVVSFIVINSFLLARRFFVVLPLYIYYYIIYFEKINCEY